MKKPERVFLPHSQFNMIRMLLQGREIYYVAGTHSMFVPSRNAKYIMSSRPDGVSIVREWPTLEGYPELMTPGEAARRELKYCFPNLRKVGWQSNDVRLFSWRWPMMFTIPMIGRGTYIDLAGAYHQLYARLWLDVAFPCGYGSLSLSSAADSLAQWKGARNSLIGITAAREATGVRGAKTFRLVTKNPYLSPHLWATIQGILNELAFLAEREGAVYIATDGYIFPSKEKGDIFQEILDDNGLKYRRYDGKFNIKSWGAYKVPEKETKLFSTPGLGWGRPFRSINILDSDNPTRLLRWWSKSIPRYSKTKWQEEVTEWQMTI